jgi:hypothetical protein
MNYLYEMVREEAGTLSQSKNPTRAAFGRHLLLVADALHDVEWVDSCDYGNGDDEEAMRKALDVGPKASGQAIESVSAVYGVASSMTEWLARNPGRRVVTVIEETWTLTGGKTCVIVHEEKL